jgi:hypothetical protein
MYNKTKENTDQTSWWSLLLLYFLDVEIPSVVPHAINLITACGRKRGRKEGRKEERKEGRKEGRKEVPREEDRKKEVQPGLQKGKPFGVAKLACSLLGLLFQLTFFSFCLSLLPSYLSLCVCLSFFSVLERPRLKLLLFN